MKQKFNLLDWMRTKTEVHDSQAVYFEKYAARITALLDEMRADGLSGLMVVNVGCESDAIGIAMSSCSLAEPSRVGARFLQMASLATGDEHGAAMVVEALPHRLEFDKCQVH